MVMDGFSERIQEFLILSQNRVCGERNTPASNDDPQEEDRHFVFSWTFAPKSRRDSGNLDQNMSQCLNPEADFLHSQHL